MFVILKSFLMFCLIFIIMIACSKVLCHFDADMNEISAYDLGNGEVISVRVQGCESSQSLCSLRAGVAYKFTVQFRANQNTDKVTVMPRFLVGDQLIPLSDEITSGDGCIGMSPQCPLESGRVYQSNGSFQMRCFPTQEYLSNPIRNDMQNVTTVGLYTGDRGILLKAVFKFTVTGCDDCKIKQTNNSTLTLK